MNRYEVKSGSALSSIVAVILLSVLVMLPLLLIFAQSFTPKGVFSLDAPLRAMMEKDLRSVFANTMLLGFLVVIGATLLAAPIAYLMAKTELGRHKWIDIVLIIPFMTPPYIGSMGWIMFMQPRGFLEQLVPPLAFLSPVFFSLFGMVMIMSLHLFPFLYLILKNAWRSFGGSLEEAGAAHGAGPWLRFRTIVLRLLLASYAMGALLIFVKTIAEFGTPATFGRRIKFYVLTTEIHKYTSHWPIDFAKAASLSLLLLGACMVIWYLHHVIAERNSFNTVGGKGSRVRIERLDGWRRWFAWGYTGGLLLFSIGIPYFSIIATSLVKLRGYGLQWGNFTLEHYAKLLSWKSPGMDALLNSLFLSLAAATAAVVLGTFLAIVVMSRKAPARSLIDFASLLPNTVPGIVLIVGLILLWNAKWNPIPLYNTYAMLSFTYMILYLPYTVQYVKANYGAIHPSLFEAGKLYGGSAFYILRRILVPLVLPGILAGWVMTFAISYRELVASLIVRPPSVHTSSTFIFTQFEQGSVSQGMAMAVVSVGITTLILVIVNNLSSGRK